jgi:putative glycosyltransferase (TIGR04348 family)
MYIGIITPAPPTSRYGNRVTAVRWLKILRHLGHRVVISESYLNEPFDLLVALHAKRSFESINSFHRERPDSPLVVALTGTDLYRDLGQSKNAQRSLDIATRILVLQPRALDELREGWVKKARVVYQSVSFPPSHKRSPQSSHFDVCVIGHLRPVKDPFRAAMASRLLPRSSRIRVTSLGGAMNARERERAQREMTLNPRYRWLGEVSRSRVRAILAQSRLFVISSRMEGGANALGEAIVAGVPVLASRISGSIGILGDDYPGYFEVGDTAQLARLMVQCETNREFLAEITSRCAELSRMFDPARERASWARLIDELEVA